MFKVNDRSLLKVIGIGVTTWLCVVLFLTLTPVQGGSDFSIVINAQDSRLTVNLSGIDPLANGFHYEGWAIVNEAPITTGKFNIDEQGALVDLSGNPIADNSFVVSADLVSASAIVITIEPAGDADDVPAATKYLGGALENGSADLSPAFQGTLGSDFLDAEGRYILATPTNGGESDENSGIWFLQFADNTLALNFSGLDSLGGDFHYEGWAIIDGAPFSTGKFNVNSAGDLIDLSGNIIANGEFKTGLDLSLASDIVLTIEPAGDTDDVPAATKLVGGSLTSGEADLATTHPATLGSDYLDATGNYILATPTNGAASDENSGIWFLDPTSNALQIASETLTPLQNGFHYEGWAIVAGSALTTGKFNVDEAGQIVDLEGNVFADGIMPVAADITTATDIVITIEPAGDTDTVPAATHIIAGAVADGQAELTVGAGGALGDDFTSATGKYILATPTNGADSDENSGIWFLDNSSGSAVAGLNLPVLPTGWQYEGWTVIDGIPVTTGRFTDVNAADESAPFSGSEAGPPFPGEDLLVNAPSGLTFPLDLAGKTAVISIEPTPDDSDAPFVLKPLVGAIPGEATDHVVYDLGNNASAFPAASATILSPVAGLALAELPDGWKYEGWVVIDGIPVTTGKFTSVNAADEMAPFSGAEPGPPFPGEDFLLNAPEGLTFPTDLAGRTAVISIEPSPDDSSAPFALKPLLGAIPTGATDHVVYEMDNNAAAFLSGTARVVSNPVPGLTLPELPDGWEYEGWVVIGGVPVTTGRFTSVDLEDASAPFSGSEPGPPFPGEDFLMNAPEGLTFPTDLAGGTAVISIEPSPDDGPAPFTLKPLLGTIPPPAADHVVYEMANNAAGFPSGTADVDNVTSVGSDPDDGLPREFVLQQNYPNPFNPSTVISFSTPEKGRVRLNIYNVLGQKIARLLDEDRNAGNHKVIFEAGDLPVGIYLYKLEAADKVEVRKMTLMK
jgi:hypothetical protein